MATQVESTIVQIGTREPFETALTISFPTANITIEAVSDNAIANSVISYNGLNYWSSDSAADLIAAANAGGGSSSYLVATKTLTNDEIKALPTVPIEIIANPGIGKTILPIVATLVLKNWVADYTNININSSIQISTTISADNILVFCEENKNSGVSNILAYGGDSLNIFSIYQGIYSNTMQPATGITPSVMINDGLSIRINNIGSGNLTGGNAANTLKVTVCYVVIDL